MNHFKERNIGKLEELQRLLIEKEEIISRLKGELASKKPITSDKLNRMVFYYFKLLIVFSCFLKYFLEYDLFFRIFYQS